MNKVVVVIDMQNDFVDGSLGTAEAQKIVPHVKTEVEAAQKSRSIFGFLRWILTVKIIWKLRKERICLSNTVFKGLRMADYRHLAAVREVGCAALWKSRPSALRTYRIF